MELQLVPRVLPSNAPPLQGGSDDDLRYASRVLQENSGNRQHSNYALADGYAPKCQAVVQTENAWPATYQQYQQHIINPQPAYRRANSYGHVPRRLYNYSRHHQNEYDIRQRADALFQRFQKSEGYTKYRSRQQKDDKNGQEQKWPDELERAFFQALVKFPPMGRRKMMHKEKQRGRNELIADYIQQVTGVLRGRKQVSSHIQVLKPFVENDPYIMQVLSKDDHGKSPSHLVGFGGPMSGRRMSTYHGAGAAMPYGTRSMHITAAETDIDNVRRMKDKLDIFQPNSFSMFVQQKIPQPDESVLEERLHTYTQSIDMPLVADVPFHEWQGSSHELLVAMSAKQQLDCNVLVADVSIGFPTASFRNMSGVELGISFVCSSNHLDPKSVVRCRNSFYRKGKRIFNEDFDAPLQHSDHRRNVTTSLKFGSNFWVKMLHQLAARLQREPTEADPEAATEVDSLLRGLTAMLEILVVSPHGNERILVMCWTFRKSSVSQGRASWRRLIMPPPAMPPLQYPEPPKNERTDSVYNYGTQYVDVPAADPLMQPTLQSPFEYEGSSGSALSSATWPTSMSDGSLSAHPDNAATFSADNSFDFNGGNINLSYDHNAAFDPTLDFSNFDNTATFDSTVFDFGTTADLVQDPALDQLTDQWWDTAASSYDVQAPLAGVVPKTHYAPQAQMEGLPQVYADFDGQFDQDPYPSQQEQQAYGGAKQDLSMLADASCLRSMLPKQEPL
ncbi:hypothetical protein LTR86_007041 [Recurvomyces mirabilis]|nr:hypothetical protein LTR86_007041 [Recurvomyces mirabilis]